MQNNVIKYRKSAFRLNEIYITLNIKVKKPCFCNIYVSLQNFENRKTLVNVSVNDHKSKKKESKYNYLSKTGATV